LEKVQPKLKEGIKDKDMPVCVKDLVDDIVEEIWPEIEELIMFELRIKY